MKLGYLWATAIFVTVGSAVTYATPLACTSGTLTSLISTNASGGCEIADKIYSNFSYSPTGTDPTSDQINVGLDNNTLADQTGLQFGTSGPVWTSSGFTVGYTVTVDPAQCVAIYGAGVTCSVMGAQLAFQGSFANPSNTAGMNATFSGATPSSLAVNDLATGNNSNQVTFSPTWTTSDIVITGTGNTGSFPIDGFSLDIYQQITPAPEPATFSIMGAGLLSLGFLGRRLRKS